MADEFGRYEQEFHYTNGTTECFYTIMGEYNNYFVTITFQGNSIRTVEITGFVERDSNGDDSIEATVSAGISGSGNERIVTITITDEYGTYEESYSYLNGTTAGAYILMGAQGKYTVYIEIQGNSVKSVRITSYLEGEDIIDPEPYAEVLGRGASRNVLVRVVDAQGVHESTFAYENGSDDGTYLIPAAFGEYVVYVTYSGNEAQSWKIIGYREYCAICATDPCECDQGINKSDDEGQVNITESHAMAAVASRYDDEDPDDEDIGDPGNDDPETGPQAIP